MKIKNKPKVVNGDKKREPKPKRIWKPKTILEKTDEIKIVQNKEKLLEEEEISQNTEVPRTKEKEECEGPMNQVVIYQNKDPEMVGFLDLEEIGEGEILEERSELEVLGEPLQGVPQILSRSSRQELLNYDDV